MDWSNVTAEELVDALREVDWSSPPRPISEFFAKFAPPKNQSKWQSRVKCNVYYYRANYVIMAILGYVVAFLRNPLALGSLLTVTLAFLFLNDTFARSTSERILRGIRKADPRLAQKIRAAAAPAGSTLGSGPANRPISRQGVKVAGVSRSLVVAALSAVSLILVYLTNALLTFALGTILGVGSVLAHASLRSPNLKARLASAREEFRAVWRGYGESSHDYTL